MVESGHALIVRTCLASSTSTSKPSSTSTTNSSSNTTNDGQSKKPDPGVAFTSMSSVSGDDDLSGAYTLDSDVIDRVLSVVASGGRPYNRHQALYAQSCHVAFDLHLWTSSPATATTAHTPPRVHKAFDPAAPFTSKGKGTSKATAAQSVPGVFSLGLGGARATVGMGKGGGGSSGTGRAKHMAAKGLAAEAGDGFAFGAGLSSSTDPPVSKQSCQLSRTTH